VKKTLLVMAIIAVFASLALAASNVPHPTAALRPSAHANTVPSYCSPCLWYGGDWDPSANWVALGNGDEYDAGTVYQYTNYVAFVVPSGAQWTVTGLLTNNLVYNFDTGANSCKLDKEENWTINTGVKSGTGGTVVASGTGTATCTYTNRNYEDVYYEYTVNVPTSSTTLSAGTYFLGAVPSCTASSCATFFYMTDSWATNKSGPSSPACLGVQNGPEGGINYVNDCSYYVSNYGYSMTSLTHWSAGVEGTISKGD